MNLNAATLISGKADSRDSSDQQLMSRLASGDQAAMHELIKQHGEMLARLIGRLTGWNADQEDILQDVLISVWQQSNSFKGAGSLEGWLKRVAVNRCRNHFRASNSIKRMIERFALTLRPDSFTEEKLTDKSNKHDAKLSAALQKLPQSDRTVLVLFYIEEMAGDELASLLNLKPETLHVRLHRARKKLKRLMDAQTEETK